jgi:hypothetical protein
MRVDILLGRAELTDGRLEPITVLSAGLILALILPWIV